MSLNFNTLGRTPAELEAMQRRLFDRPPADIEKRFGRQVLVVPDTEKKGQTGELTPLLFSLVGHYRNDLVKYTTFANPSAPLQKQNIALWPDIDVVISSTKPQTLYELFNQATIDATSAPCLAHLPVISPTGVTPALYGEEFVYQSYKQISDRRLSIGSGLMYLYRSGVLGKEVEQIDTTLPKHLGWGVGIWISNRPEWQIVDLGCQAFCLVTAPLYDTLGPDATEYVTNHASLAVIFTSAAHLPATLGLLKKCPSVKAVVCVDDSILPLQRDMAMSFCTEMNVWFGTFSDLEKLGEQHPHAPIPPRPHNIATISYTSGTTGQPKGVVLTHRNLTSACVANLYGQNMPAWGGTYAGYLPLSHIFERFAEINTFYCRSCVCYTTGDVTRLLQDLQLIKPHIIMSVPRVLNKIYAAIIAQTAVPGLKSALLQRALDVKSANGKVTGTFTHAFYDRVVFSKVKQLLGGRLLFIGTGSAPLSPAVHEVLRASLYTELCQGWGMTETCGSGTRGYPTDIKAVGTVGPPIPGIEIKLVDIPELGYRVTDKPYPRGELVVRGHFVFSKYYKDEKNTKETVDPDGFVHTGDVCQVDEAGRFKIIDRKKNIMKLAQGEYVALEAVEAALAVCPLFASLFIYGNSFKSHLVAVGIIDPVQAAPIFSKELGRNITPEAIVGMLGDKKIKAAAIKQLTLLGKSKRLNGFEIPKGIHLTAMPFPEELLTPSMKFKRPQIAKHYEKELDGAYQESEVSSKL